MRFRELKIHKDPNCPICRQNPTITNLEEYDYADFCGIKKQEEEEAPVEAIEAKELKRRLDQG